MLAANRVAQETWSERGRARSAPIPLFMALMTPAAIQRLVDLTTEQWRAAIPRWERRGTVVLDDEMALILCRAVCAWAGVPLAEDDARLWAEPDAFRPERLRRSDGNAFALIPQGGGDHYVNHRCPGESPTVALIEASVRLLLTSLRYDVPEQDLSIDLRRMPARPKSRFVITNVRQRELRRRPAPPGSG